MYNKPFEPRWTKSFVEILQFILFEGYHSWLKTGPTKTGRSELGGVLGVAPGGIWKQDKFVRPSTLSHPRKRETAGSNLEQLGAVQVSMHIYVRSSLQNQIKALLR